MSGAEPELIPGAAPAFGAAASPSPLRYPARMNARLFRMALALLFLPPLSGCLRQYAPPSFEIIGASVSEQTDDGFVVTFSLKGENANDVPLPLKQVNYNVDLGGRRVFSGRRVAGATLPRFSSQIIELPAAVSAETMSAAALDEPLRFGLSGEMTYVTPGLLADILFDSGVRRPSTTFTRRGTLNPLEEGADSDDAPDAPIELEPGDAD